MTAPTRTADLITQLADALASEFAAALRGQLDAHLAALPAVRVDQVPQQAAEPTLPPS